MQLQILDTDWFFKDSPNAGEPDCICSRCHEKIKEDEVPLRSVTDQKSLYAKNALTGAESRLTDRVNGLELRFCEACQSKMGIRALPKNYLD